MPAGAFPYDGMQLEESVNHREGLLFEVRQDLLGDDAGIAAWAERLGGLLAAALEHPSLDHLAPPATDLVAPRYVQEEPACSAVRSTPSRSRAT